MDEGYIKFRVHWQEDAPVDAPLLPELIRYRNLCCEHNWIGQYDNGIGFGNISVRTPAKPLFLITGSATGGVRDLSAVHISQVEKVDASSNQLWCRGPIVASSESMSHAAIYEKLPWVQGVIHIHQLELWQKALHAVPTTAADAPYGSPEMVDSIIDLIETTDLAQQKVFVMEGHEEGLFAFGRDLQEAYEVLLATAERFLRA